MVNHTKIYYGEAYKDELKYISYDQWNYLVVGELNIK